MPHSRKFAVKTPPIEPLEVIRNKCRLLIAMRKLSVLLICIAAIATFERITKVANADEESEWLGIYSGNDKIGYSQTTYKSDSDKTEISEFSKLRMTVLGTEQEVEIESKYRLKGFRLDSFQFSMKANAVKIKAKGRREGNEVRIIITSASGDNEISVKSPEDALVSPVIFRWLARRNPEPGKIYSVPVFDPSVVLSGADSETSKAALIVEGRDEITTPAGKFGALKVRMTSSAGEITTWITDEGEIVKQLSPPGITALKETGESAAGDKLASIDIIEKTAVSSDAPLENSRKLKFLRVGISGISSVEGLNLNDNYRQRYSDGALEIRVSTVSKPDAYSIPYSGGDLVKFTEATKLIQSGDKKILDTVDKILRGEKNSLRAARRINNWVYRKLKKTPTVSFPNALDVLKTKSGDCTEHATLFAALARAAGIPTKIALGVVFLDGKFYYHAWNEVYLGAWVAADPTLGQLPADASHIKFIEGDFDKASEIARLVGRIKLEIKEARYNN